MVKLPPCLSPSGNALPNTTVGNLFLSGLFREFLDGRGLTYEVSGCVCVVPLAMHLSFACAVQNRTQRMRLYD
jgi:hypothetical protein